MSQASYSRRVVDLHHRSTNVQCGDLYAPVISVSSNRRTHANRQETAQRDHRCCFSIIVGPRCSPGNPTESQSSRYSSHTHPRALYSFGTVDSFRRIFARGTGVPQAYRPTIVAGVFVHYVDGETHTRSCLNCNTISIHASALDAVLVSGVLIVARGPTLSRHAGVSIVL